MGTVLEKKKLLEELTGRIERRKAYGERMPFLMASWTNAALLLSFIDE